MMSGGVEFIKREKEESTATYDILMQKLEGLKESLRSLESRVANLERVFERR